MTHKNIIKIEFISILFYFLTSDLSPFFVYIFFIFHLSNIKKKKKKKILSF